MDSLFLYIQKNTRTKSQAIRLKMYKGIDWEGYDVY